MGETKEEKRGQFQRLEGEIAEESKRLAIAIGGAAIYSAGVNLFIVPAGLYSGGIMGFAQIVRTILVSYLHLPIQNFDIAGLIYYAINIPVLLLGMKDIGKQFFVKTICCLTAVTIFLSFIPIPTETLLHNDILGSTVIGALMCGFGMGTALRMGASLGGTDIIALLLIKWKKNISVGKVNIIKISSRDPEPPPVSYVKVSGGIFYDMMIHDFDMARFLAGSEVTEVNAVGSVLVDPGIGEAGDVDTALVTLKFENGAIGVIDNSRKAVYGYDQRVEVFGSEGCAEDQNDTPNTAVLSTADGAVHGVAYKVMWDRYTGAFVAEMQAFADAVVNDKETPVTGEDGLYPVLMAAAATKSLHEGRPVKISEIE